GLRQDLNGSALSMIPPSVSSGARISGLPGSPFAAACPVARPPWTDLTGACPATGGFYFQACNGLVTLPATGYHYDSHWTLLSVGLAPTGMSASLAAPDPCALAWEHTVRRNMGLIRPFLENKSPLTVVSRAPAYLAPPWIVQ